MFTKTIFSISLLSSIFCCTADAVTTKSQASRGTDDGSMTSKLRQSRVRPGGAQKMKAKVSKKLRLKAGEEYRYFLSGDAPHKLGGVNIRHFASLMRKNEEGSPLPSDDSGAIGFTAMLQAKEAAELLHISTYPFLNSALRIEALLKHFNAISALTRAATLEQQHDNIAISFSCLDKASELAVTVAQNLQHIPWPDSENSTITTLFNAGTFQTAYAALNLEARGSHGPIYIELLNERFGMQMQSMALWGEEVDDDLEGL